MKTITTTQLEQVSGGYSQCLLSIYDVVSNSSQCLIKVSGEMPVLNIPMEYAAPLMMIAMGIQIAYDLQRGSKNLGVHLPVVDTSVKMPELTLNMTSN